MEAQVQTKKPLTAKRRGLYGAAIGYVVATIIGIVVLCVSYDGDESVPIGLAMIAVPFQGLIGIPYGFGMAFANLRLVLEKTKRATAQGLGILGIGIILSSLTDDNRWGMWGWIIGLFRISWHLGMAWIPGTYYGIRAIMAERKETVLERAREPKPKRSPASPAAASGAVAAVKHQAQNVASSATARPVAASVEPQLICTNGIFQGASFPVMPEEEILVGSDPSACQIVLPPELAWPIHCSLRYCASCRCWQVRDLSSGNTFQNGFQPLAGCSFHDLPSGTQLCIGRGKTSQRFQLG